MPAVQEFSDDGRTAEGPWAGAVDLNESGGHHVVVLKLPKHVLTRPHVVVWHVEHVSCRGGNKMPDVFRELHGFVNPSIVHMHSRYRKCCSTCVC